MHHDVTSPQPLPLPAGGTHRVTGPSPTVVRERVVREWTCLTVLGELDIVSAPRLAVLVREHARRGVRRLCVDLSGVPFLDTAGVAMLINAQRAVTRAGGELVVLAGPGRVRDLLDLTSATRIVRVETTFDAVLAGAGDAALA